LPLDMMHPFYPRDCKEGTKLFFIINRVFNDKLEEVNISFDNPFEGKIHDSYPSGGYRYDKKVLNLTEVVEKYHIPRNYYLELFVQSLYNEKTNKTVFPGEIKFNTIDKVSPLSKDDIEDILVDFEPDEIISVLSNLGYAEIATDLKKGLVRFDYGDNEGAIKFFRKVVEGFRQQKLEEIIRESNRSEKIRKYIDSTFNLLSNFGEHTGTIASEEEAVLGKYIAMGLAEYFVVKLRISK